MADAVIEADFALGERPFREVYVITGIGAKAMAKNLLFQSRSAVGLSRNDSGQSVAELQQYLQRFGYLHAILPEDHPLTVARNASAPQFTSEVFDEATETALKTYQHFYGLPISGILDQATIAHMSRPRCGFPDNPNRPGAANFAAQGNRWNKPNLTYRFQEFTADFNQQDIRNALAVAFGLWNAVTPLTFTEVTGSADIVVRFVTGDHGDGSPFDGVGNVLAHGFYPPPNGGDIAGDVHFDDAETWTINIPPTGTDLITVAAHEIGHALGLDHSNVQQALMFAFYGGPHRFLHQDDTDGIRSVYGARAAGNPVLIQSRFGAKGNFELVVPSAGGGLAFYFRNNDDPSFPWNGPFPFGQSAGQVEAVTLIQSNFGDPGNLELVARVGDRLAFFFRDSGPAFNWNGPFFLS